MTEKADARHFPLAYLPGDAATVWAAMAHREGATVENMDISCAAEDQIWSEWEQSAAPGSGRRADHHYSRRPFDRRHTVCDSVGRRVRRGPLMAPIDHIHTHHRSRLEGTGTLGNEAAIHAEHLGARARPDSRYSGRDFRPPTTLQKAATTHAAELAVIEAL